MGIFDVVIAGAGIAGASAAYELSRTRRVLLLEQESQPGYHTTGRSAALFIDFYGNEAVRALTAASKECFFTPPDGFAEVPLVNTREAFLIATPDQAAALHAVVDEFARTGLQLPAENCHEIEARVLVNAAGAWAGRIAELAGAAAISLRPLRRSMLVLDSRDTNTIAGIGRWPLVADVGEHWYFKPESGQLLRSPFEEDEIDACDAVADDMVIAQAVDRLERVLDLQVRHTPHSWAGLRTFADDRSPVVGYDPGLEGFFWPAGQGGFGIQTAPAMGRIAAALIAGSDFPGDMRKLGLREDHIAPARFFNGN
jgi:glycine/D-amino acid oxidase-like deaminating enzyme